MPATQIPGAVLSTTRRKDVVPSRCWHLRLASRETPCHTGGVMRRTPYTADFLG
jgi:hypothetical protein